MSKSLSQLYDKTILNKPIISLIVITLIVIFFSLFIRDFRLDASSDALVLEHDPGLKYYRSIRAIYGSDDYLIITYKPKQALFSEAGLKRLGELRDQLKKLKRVKSVFTILDAPLIASPPMSLSEFERAPRTLESPDANKTLAIKEFLSGPFYKNLLLSRNTKTTAIQVIFHQDDKFFELLRQRNKLREKKLHQSVTAQELQQLQQVTKQFEQQSQQLQQQVGKDINDVRAILKQYQPYAKTHLAGVPMIVADSIGFIRHDISLFGIGVLCFMVIILSIAFRKPRWVILPMLTCFVTSIIMVGFLGLINWPVTIVSSNFISLLLIITLSLTIHLVVRYQEIQQLNPDFDQFTLVRNTVHSKFRPCFYTATTTMVAFGSLILCDIRPIIDFGWMMFFGIAIALVMTFTLFPACLLLLKPGKLSKLRNITRMITGLFAILIRKFDKTVLIVFSVLFLFGVIGLNFLSVENRFIDYFKQSTDIYQGMILIDQELGGTTPLDVIIDAPKSHLQEQQAIKDIADFDEEPLGEAGITASSYWFNRDRLEQVHAIHNYLENLSESGKVLSLSSSVKMLDIMDKDKLLNDFYLSVLYKRISKPVRNILFTPYLSADGNQVRYAIRVFESDKSLKRDKLIKKVKQQLTQQFALEKDQVQLTGMLVLYNNMLKSLFRSQILTLGFVFFAILIMFAVLFRSIKLAGIAIIPNIFVSILVLGLMGFAGIPLDLMTITIAAISIGIAVDNTIHYIHRFSDEVTKDSNYWAAVKRSHASIGLAMYYTTMTITLGFSILVLSNFVPTIYFGLLTGLAMITALIADLALLPLLLVHFKPFKLND